MNEQTTQTEETKTPRMTPKQRYASFVEQDTETIKFRHKKNVEIQRLTIESENCQRAFEKDIHESFLWERLMRLRAVGQSVMSKYGINYYRPEIDIDPGFKLRWIYDDLVIDSLSDNFIHVYPRAVWMTENPDKSKRLAIPRHYLHMSDRDFAKLLRAAIKRYRVKESRPVIAKAKAEIKELEESILKIQKQIDAAQKKADKAAAKAEPKKKAVNPTG